MKTFQLLILCISIFYHGDSEGSTLEKIANLSEDQLTKDLDDLIGRSAQRKVLYDGLVADTTSLWNQLDTSLEDSVIDWENVLKFIESFKTSAQTITNTTELGGIHISLYMSMATYIETIVINVLDKREGKPNDKNVTKSDMLSFIKRNAIKMFSTLENIKNDEKTANQSLVEIRDISQMFVQILNSFKDLSLEIAQNFQTIIERIKIENEDELKPI